MSPFDVDSEGEWKFPLLLSTLAGASTCVGAAVVFCFQPKTIRDSMPFSLSLAGSVMITVSVISIGPECLRGIAWDDEEADDEHNDNQSSPMELLFARLCWFTAGCLSYILLSKLAFPEATDLVLAEDGDVKSNQQHETEKLLSSVSDDSSSSQSRASIETTGSMHAAGDESKKSPNKNGGSKQARMRRSKNNPSSNQDSDHPTPKETSANDDVYQKSPAAKRSSAAPTTPSKGSSLSRWSAGTDLQSDEARRSWRVAMLLFVSLLCHNFPEGLAVAASTMESRHLGITVAVGILIHNIPEGIAIAVPCIAARPDSPWLAFLLASGSGLAEPLGAFLALCVLPKSHDYPSSPFTSMECILASVAGIMISVALVELYPEAWRHGINHSSDRRATIQSIGGGTILGAAMMVITELCI